MTAAAEQAPPPDDDLRVPKSSAAAPLSLVPDKRADVLGSATSTDRAVTTASDAAGFHVLVADVSDGYRWRTAASLSEPGFETDAWIGNMCVTASGDRAVVVYAPRTFTNELDLAQRGGFTAVVDLNGGQVRKLDIQTSLAYFNPGCGPTETAILTQEGTEDRQRTRLLELDTVSGNLATPIEVPGQLTSPVSTATGIVAADSGAVVRVAPDGARTVLAEAKGVPYRLAADADGGVVFAQTDNTKSSSVRRVTLPEKGRGTVTTLATGAITDLSVRSAKGGQVYVTGRKTPKVRATPASVVLADTEAGATPSLGGEIAVTKVWRTNTKDPRVMPAEPTAPQPVDVTAVSLVTGKEFTLSATPVSGAGQGAAPSPALPSAKAAGDPNNPADGDQRTCSVPRNDPANQAMQPKPRQVEWAVDQAVRGVLTVQRPQNWKNLGMPAYTPQGLFPRTGLSGGGYIPAQVMLGVIAQESNMWQAARFAVPSVTANPLIGNYFGIDYYNDTEADDWTIRWGEADCGYGVGQITDGMRKGGMDYNHQRAIALDFAANVAKAVQMLEQKWNETRAAGVVVEPNGQPQWLENWFFAVWAYNSGFHPQSEAGQHSGAWGVGWLNNPANPRYPANRTPFMDASYADAAHPQDWPYPEKVMGFAGHPIELIETPGTLVHGYRAAWWVTDEDRWNVKPPIFQFCDGSNNCDPDDLITPNDPEVIGEPAGPCGHRNGAGLYDLKCWYHIQKAWKVCPQVCGNELLRFDPGYAYQEDAASYPPNCGRGGLPDGAFVIDNLPPGVPSIRPGCATTAASGSFQFTFSPNAEGNFPGKIDVHQMGSGFGGQFWMSNTHQAFDRRAIGTWTFNRSVGEWGRLLVHLPVIGARTQQAKYDIDLDGNGTFDATRYIPQEIKQNGWVSLGVYRFTGAPRIRLSNQTDDGAGTTRIAWDAIAVQPLPQKPKHIVAALGDSYSSGEGASNYLTPSDLNHGTEQWNACRRSRDAWPRKVVLPGDGTSLGALSDQLGPNHELGFVACSGAKTWNVGGWGVPQSWDEPEKYETGDGQFHEMSQIDSGVLDANTTLVLLTIGGNDGGAFVNALMDCAGIGNCANDSDYLPTYKGLIDTAITNTDQLLRQIHTKAGNADIILMGYPELFSRTIKCAGSWYFDLTEVHALAELAAYTATKQRDLAASLRSAGIPVNAASPIDEFVGHGACDDPEWIHKFRLGANGEGDFHNGDKPSPFCFWDILGGACLSRESFHPNGGGTSGYSTVLRRKLDEIGYNG